MNTFQLFGSLLAATLLLTQTATAQNGNYFAGSEAGSNNTTGDDNTFVGYRVGFRNTEGSSNSFLGRSAGRYNTIGSNNVFLCISGYQRWF